MKIVPQTKPGKWSVGLCICFFVFIGMFFILVASGQRGGMKFFDNPILAIPTVLAALTAIAGLFIGLQSVISHKEKSLLTFIAIAIGAFVLYFTIGELVSKH